MVRNDFTVTGINKAGKPYRAWTRASAKAWISYVLHNPDAMSEVHLHLSDHNIKLNALMFSTPAGDPNAENYGMGTCAGMPCQGICYAIKTEKFRPSAFIANMENALMLKFAFNRAVAEFSGILRKYDQKCKNKGVSTMVRWHESGEFTPEDSALLDAMAEMFPHVKFYGYTKKAEYYCKYYNAKNINILWSGWRGMPVPEAVKACGPIKAFFVEFNDGDNAYMAEFITDKKRVRRCPGLINGKFACNVCGFNCAKSLVMIAHEH